MAWGLWPTSNGVESFGQLAISKRSSIRVIYLNELMAIERFLQFRVTVMPRYWKVTGTGTRPVALNRSYSQEKIEDINFRLGMILISSTQMAIGTPFGLLCVPPNKRPEALTDALRPRSLTIKSKTSSNYTLIFCLMPYKVLFSLTIGRAQQ